MNRTDSPIRWSDIVLCVTTVLSAVPLAFLIHFINEASPNQPERAVQIIAACFAILVALPPSIYILRRRGACDPGTVGLIVLASISILLVSIYFYRISFYVLFPADILIWSESDFVNDILKFRLGYPIYNAPEDNESSIYTPGAKILTYFLAWLTGNPMSIPIYRLIQLVYTLLASVFAASCCRRLLEMTVPIQRSGNNVFWAVVWSPILFLIATNFLTNPFVHNLHNDASTQLISVAAYWALLVYISDRSRSALLLMAIIPATGFLIKQSLVIWAPLYGAYLILFDRPFSIARLVNFTFGTAGALVAVLLGCYILWGDNFVYWVTVLRDNSVSPLRGFQHLLDSWAYFAIGLLGGLILLRGKSAYLMGAWLIWLSLFLIETYTSGIAWMRNHMGPGSLIAGIWFIAGMVRLWSSAFPTLRTRFHHEVFLRVVIAVSLVALLFSGLGVVRIPVKPLPDDAYRYVREIAREFDGQSRSNILLDAGSWLYLPDGVVMKDRVASIGDRGLNGSGDFSGTIQRLERKEYSKILVRNFHAPGFHYDDWTWPKSSGVKKTMLAHYAEVGKIRQVVGRDYRNEPPYLFSEITIFAPKPD